MSAEDSTKYFVPSDKLKELNDAIAAWKELAKQLEKAVQFRVVIDSNIVVGDIRWLTIKRKVPGARTALIETILAGTVDAYVPPELFKEVEEHLLRISVEDKISHAHLTQQWVAYKQYLKVLEVDSALVESYTDGVDPDDAYFIALAHLVAAAGIVSNDRHIKQMGGNQISIHCILSLRDYSRAKAIELNIKFSGLSLGIMSVVGFIGLFQAVKALIVAVQKAPDWVKITLVVAALVCVLHPGARKKITTFLTRALEGIKSASPQVAVHIAEAAAVAESNRLLAENHLKKAMQELEHHE